MLEPPALCGTAPFIGVPPESRPSTLHKATGPRSQGIILGGTFKSGQQTVMMDGMGKIRRHLGVSVYVGSLQVALMIQ